MMSVPFSPKENSVPNRTELCLLQFSVCLLLFLNMNEWRLARYICFASTEDGIVLAWGTSLQIVVHNYVLFSDIKGLGNVECFKWCFNPVRFFIQTSDTTSFGVCVCMCVYMLMCLYEVSSQTFSTSFLRQVFSLNLEFTNLARFAGQWVPGI